MRELVHHRTALLEQARALHSALAIDEQSDSHQDDVVIATLTDVESQLAHVDEALLRASPTLAAQFLPQPVLIRDVQKSLGEKEAVLLQVVTDRSVHLLCITRSSAFQRRVVMTRADVRESVRRLRRALDLGLPRRDFLSFDPKLAAHLYEAFIAPFESELQHVERLIVVPDDAMESLPISLLVRSLRTDGSAASMVVDRWPVAVLPSLQSIVALRQSQVSEPAERPYAAFADPVILSAKATTLTGTQAVTEAVQLLSSLEELPDTTTEVRAIAAALHGSEGDLYLRERATKGNVRAAALEHYRVISFATHGIMAGELPGLSEPALVLSPSSAADSDVLLTALRGRTAAPACWSGDLIGLQYREHR